jgi:hypothetical protein
MRMRSEAPSPAFTEEPLHLSAFCLLALLAKHICMMCGTALCWMSGSEVRIRAHTSKAAQ